MLWDDFRRSANIEDRRDAGPMAGGGGGMGGGLGIGGLIIVGLISWALGIDPRILIGGLETVQDRNARRPAGPVRRRRARRQRGPLDGNFPPAIRP